MIVGIDIGTQSLKAVVINENMKVLGESAHSYAPVFPQPGWAEQDPVLWEEGLSLAIAGSLQTAEVRPAQVKALGVAGQLDGCLPVGPDGRALHNCLIWMDRRAESELADVQGIEADSLRRITGITLDASHMAAKILWFLGNVASSREALCFHQPVSYMVARLTGEHVYDHALASTSMLYSLKKGGYDDKLLDAFGFDSNRLPKIKDAWAKAGKLSAEGANLSGLPEGIPVAVGTGDDYSTPLGAGLIKPGQMACVLGTAEVVGALDTSPKIDDQGLVETHKYFGETYFIENPGWLSGGALEWFVNTFRLSGVEEMVSLAQEVPAGSEGLFFLPALSGAMAPEWIESARGCFYGLTPVHSTAHMARAVLEGCAFAMRDVLERLRFLEVPIESILLLGGGARSRLWAQIRADISGLPVGLPSRLDTSPIGAAMLAAVAANIQPHLEACAGLVEGAETEYEGKITLEPNPGHVRIYNTAYSTYGRLFNSLRPMFTI
ncbi:MAG: xylulokinase [Planctomycetota bacterium]|jgi:xylulokinase